MRRARRGPVDRRGGLVTPAPIRVAVADDQGVVRAGIVRILGPADGFEVVAQCADGAELLAATAATPVGLVVMDVRMPAMDGIEATRRLRARPGAPPVLILTTSDDDDVLWGRSRRARPASCSRTPAQRI